MSLVGAAPFADAAYYPLIGEALVVVVEAIVLNRVLGFEAKQAAAYSLVTNMVSFGLGLIIL